MTWEHTHITHKTRSAVIERICLEWSNYKLIRTHRIHYFGYAACRFGSVFVAACNDVSCSCPRLLASPSCLCLVSQLPHHGSVWSSIPSQACSRTSSFVLHGDDFCPHFVVSDCCHSFHLYLRSHHIDHLHSPWSRPHSEDFFCFPGDAVHFRVGCHGDRRHGNQRRVGRRNRIGDDVF